MPRLSEIFEDGLSSKRFLMSRRRGLLMVGTMVALLFGATSCKHSSNRGVATGSAGTSSGTSSATAGKGGLFGGGGLLGGGGKPGSFQLKDAATQYDVTYTPETVQFSQSSALGALRNVSDDGCTYTFDASSSDAQKLKPGSVMLLSGVALRKVTSASRTADGIVVQTENAEITDAIQNGTIKSHLPVDFGSMQSAANEMPPSPVDRWSLLPKVYASGGTITTVPPSKGKSTYSIQMDPFNYTIAFTPVPGQLNIEMTVTDTTSSLGYKATGYIKNFDVVMDMVIEGDQVTKYDLADSGIEGDLVLTWNGGSQVAGPAAKIGSWTEKIKDLPALKGLFFPFPFYVGAIPFTLKVTGGLIFVPAFTSKNTSLDGQLHMHYGGSGGFTVDHGQTAQSGNIVPTPPQNPTTQAISLGPFGFMIAAEFPRLELGLGINLYSSLTSQSFGFSQFTPTGYLNAVTAFGITYGGPAAMLPCETHVLDFSVNTGIAVSSTFLSVFKTASKLSVEKQIFKKTYTAAKPGLALCPS